MADTEGAGPKKDVLTDGLFALLILLILFALFQNGAQFLEERFGLELGYIPVLRETIPLDDNTPHGTRVAQKSDGSLYQSPGGTVLGTVANGAPGKVIGGPVLRDGVLWWQIRYDDGTEGWVSEDDIGIDLLRNPEALTTATPRGTPVLITGDAIVYRTPDGQPIDTREVGDEAIIIDGPEVRSDGNYWKVRFSDGTEGWLQEDMLVVNVEQHQHAVTENTPLGTKVTIAGEVGVWDRPGGLSLGIQDETAEGIIDAGPAYTGENRWWNIDFKDEPDGWVREGSLRLIDPIGNSIAKTKSFFRTLSFMLSALLLAGIVYIAIRQTQVNHLENEKFGYVPPIVAAEERGNPQWERIQEYIHSDNPNNWRLAILEADIMLQDLVTSLGYRGDTLGEQLQTIEASDFLTLNQAWEAHKVRNRIAHDGIDYVLTRREADRVIGLFEAVFREFHYL